MLTDITSIATLIKNTKDNLGTSGIRGVAIYIKENLISKEVKLSSIFEGHVWVEIKLTNNEILLCGCVYRSPTKLKNEITDITLKVSQVITEASLRNPTNLLICGDFNYPEIDWEYEYANDNSESITPFLETVQAQFLHQHVFEPTRFRDGNAPGLLDLILTNDENMIFEILHNPGLGESDHECLSFTLNCYKEEKKNRIRPNFLKADYETIRARLNKINWTAKLNGKFLTAYKVFTESLSVAMKGCVPDFTSGKQRNNIYLTPEAVREKDLKNKLWRRYKRTRSQYDRRRFISISDIDMNKTWPTMLKMHPNDSGHTLNRSLKLGVESQR